MVTPIKHTPIDRKYHTPYNNGITNNGATMKKLSLFIAIIIIIASFAGCRSASPDMDNTPELIVSPTPEQTASPTPQSDEYDNKKNDGNQAF